MRAAPPTAATISPDPQIAKANFQQWLAESEPNSYHAQCALVLHNQSGPRL
jgi:hypothetical protein